MNFGQVECMYVIPEAGVHLVHVGIAHTGITSASIQPTGWAKGHVCLHPSCTRPQVKNLKDTCHSSGASWASIGGKDRYFLLWSEIQGKVRKRTGSKASAEQIYTVQECWYHHHHHPSEMRHCKSWLLKKTTGLYLVSMFEEFMSPNHDLMQLRVLSWVLDLWFIRYMLLRCLA